MRILFVTPELPNPLHRVRSLNLVRGLGQRHELDLVSLAHEAPSAELLEALRPSCRRIDWVLQPRWRSLAQSALGLLGPSTLEACYERSPVLARLIRQRLDQCSYDVVYVKRLRMAQYGALAPNLPRVLDLTDSMARFYDLARQRAPWPSKALFWEEWLKHQHYEPRLAATFERCVVASPIDAAHLRDVQGLRNVDVVPNSVDTDFYRPRAGDGEPSTFLLSGLMDKLVNVDAALYLDREIWPRVRAEIPAARLRLVGPQPSRAVRALHGRDGIEVVGFAPDLRDEIARATAVLVPLRIGTGTKNKVMQALAMERAVVSTSVGNEGLGAQSGRHLIVADRPAEFAAAVVRLARDPPWRASLGADGRAWVVERYGVPAVIERLGQILADVVDGRCSSPKA